MKKMFIFKEILKWSLIVLCILSAGLIGYSYLSAYNKITGKMTLSSPYGLVIIDRDTKGIPLIKALSNDLGAFYALGFATAQDRYWQLEFQRHVAGGTLSELFGEVTVSADKYFRNLGLHQAAGDSLPFLSKKTRDAVHAYTLGINAFLKSGRLPLQFKILHYTPQTWKDTDILDEQKLLSSGMINDYKMQWENLNLLLRMNMNDLRELRDFYPADAVTTLTTRDLKDAYLPAEKNITLQASIPSQFVVTPPLKYEHQDWAATNRQQYPLHRSETISSTDFTGPVSGETGNGSNAWAVDGSVTESGRPLLASDPHLGLNMPGTWYLAHLQGPSLNVQGATYPGIPFVLIGHDANIAWGITVADVETATLYLLPPHVKLTTTTERIKVRNKPDFLYTVRYSDIGPVINDQLGLKTDAQQTVALGCPVFSHQDTTLDAFYGLNYAANWRDFRKAMSRVVSPALNIIYADTAGNIGYQLTGEIPLRIRTSDSNLPAVPEWYNASLNKKNNIPFNSLPFILNPKNHYIISANNKIVDDNYPYILVRENGVGPFRAERIRQLLTEKTADHKLGMSDMTAIQNDTFSLIWISLKPLLLSAHFNDHNATHGKSLLLQWNGHMDMQSTGATVFAYWLRELVLTLRLPWEMNEWGMEYVSLVHQLKDGGILCHTSAACQMVIGTTLSKAMEKLNQELGSDPDKWQWGRIHTAKFIELGVGHIPILGKIWNRSISSPGGIDTVNLGQRANVDFVQDWGPSYRQVIDLGNLPNSQYIIPTGQSDNPFSRNFADMMNLWRNGKYIRFATAPPGF